MLSQHLAVTAGPCNELCSNTLNQTERYFECRITNSFPSGTGSNRGWWRETLLDEYTTTNLILYTVGDLALLGPFATMTWGTGQVRANCATSSAAAVPNAFRDLTADEMTITMRAMQYRIGFQSQLGTVQQVNWIERFISEDGTLTNDTALTEAVAGTGGTA